MGRSLSFFQLLEDTHIPWLRAASSILKAHHSASVIISALTLVILLPLCWDPCDHVGLTQLIQDNLPSQVPSFDSRLQSPFLLSFEVT